jgi:hypothetical protein
MSKADLTDDDFEAILKANPMPPWKERPKPPELTVASEQELSLERMRERHARSQRRLMQEEKDRAVAHNKRVFAELRAERNRPLTPQERYEQFLNYWIELQRQAAAHERWLRRELDPENLGLYEVEPFHRGA